MSFKFNGTGNFSIPAWSSGVGNYSIKGAFRYPTEGTFQTMMAGGGTAHLLCADTGGTLKVKHGTTAILSGLVVSTDYWYEESRTVNTITINVFNYNVTTKVKGSLVSTGTIAYGGTNVPYDAIGGTTTGTIAYKNELSGTWEFTNDTGGIRTYEFDQAVGTPNLPESTSGQHGTAANSLNGVYTGSGTDSISITSHTDGQFLMRSSLDNSRLVTLSGEIVGTQPTSVEVQVDNGTWQTIDASPTATWSGSVTIKGKQYVKVRGVGSDTITPNITLTVGLTIVALGDSNQYGYGLNHQPVDLPAFSHQPLMYNGSALVNVTDPTVNGANGSTLPRLVSRYAADGTPVCIYNIGRGGTVATDWQKGGADYNKMIAFNTLIGGIELVTVMLGTNDAANAVTQVSFTNSLNNMVNDIATDFNAKSLITRFASVSVGSAANRTAIMDSITDVVTNNVNAYEGGDLRSIDIATATATGNDGIHLKQDADLTTAADLIYEANQLLNVVYVETSTFSVSATNIPNGIHLTTFFDDAIPANFIVSKNVTYTGGACSDTVEAAEGAQVYALVRDGLNPSLECAPLKSITTALVEG